MSERQATTEKTETALYVHYCERPGCKKWGSFGFAVGKLEPNWFCFEHRPDAGLRDA